MDTVSVPLCPTAYKEAFFRRSAFSPYLSRSLSQPLAILPLQSRWLTESETPMRSRAEAITMLYDRILHFVLSQLDPLALDAELRQWCTQGINNGHEGLVSHVRSCVFGDNGTERDER